MHWLPEMYRPSFVPNWSLQSLGPSTSAYCVAPTSSLYSQHQYSSSPSSSSSSLSPSTGTTTGSSSTSSSGPELTAPVHMAPKAKQTDSDRRNGLTRTSSRRGQHPTDR